MKRIHLFSGVILSLFITIHLFNHLVALLGVEAHIQFMNATRQVYQHPIGESILLFACLVQFFSGINLVRKKGWKQTKWFNKLHVYSGLYLALFLIAHPAAILYYRYVSEIDTNFYLAAVTINYAPLMFVFIPYYFLGVLAFFVHIACIHRIKIARFKPKWSPNSQAKWIIGLGIVVGVLIILAMTDFGQGIVVPLEYQELFDLKLKKIGN
jgi:succinate dehydrogenase/fumarate reductase cytochrome b subunit